MAVTFEPLKSVAEINPRRPASISRLPDEHEVTFVPMPAVDQRLGQITGGEVRPLSEVKRGFTYFEEGDVIFAKITPCMQNGKSAVARNLANGLGMGSTEFHVLRPQTDRVIPEWLWYFVRQQRFRDEAARHFRGAVGQQRVPEEYLANSVIPVPTLPEQRRIVARIKECMNRIDEIEKLSETSAPEVKALSRSFYREQYERLCAEYETCRLDQAAKFMGGGTPSKQNPSFWTGSIPWISPKDMKRRDLHDATDHISDAAINGSSAKLISEPSVLFVVRGMILAHTLPIAVNRVPVAINQDMKAAVPSEGFDVDFLATMLRGAEKTLLSEVEIAGHGTCRLQQPHWSGIPIPVLSPAKQADVVAAAQAFESIADRLLTEVTMNERSAMRAAVLRKAFAGEM